MAEKSKNPEEGSIVFSPRISVASTFRYNQSVFVWDEKKRQANLVKHKLDFVAAGLVYFNPAKLTTRTERQGEGRYVDTAIVEVNGNCLTLVYTPRGDDIRLISFRSSSRDERNRLAESRRPD